MSRLKRLQIIDDLINEIRYVIENRCSLSDEDLIILDNALNELELMKYKKGATLKEVRKKAAKVVELLTEYFIQ